jgi:DNA mismatch repair protein MLH3
LLKSTPNIGSYVATNSEPRADFAEDPTAINDVKSANEREKWLPGFLREWKNPVFALRKEPPIPVASYHGPGLLFSATEIDHHSCHSRANGAEFHSSDKGINLSKAALREARVISQVDQKFILAVLPPVGENVSSGTSPAPPTPTSRSKHADTLILIDQHAASERVMLEELLNDLCTPTTGGHPLDDADKEVLEILRPVTRVHSVPLQPVLEFDIPLSEQVVLEKYRAWFLKWGFIYQLSSLAAPKEPPISSHPFPALRSHVPVSGSPTLTRTKKKSNELRLKLTHLPPCIAARCQKEPKLAIDLIRGEAWRVAEEGVPKDVTIGKRARKIATDTASHTDHDHEESYDLATTAEDKDSRKATDTPVWLPVLPLIPPALLSLLHSRACRSAIMFNDVLNRPACEELVKKLSKCVFPFVCAHGRVGVVPVGVLDGETGEGSGLGSSIGLDLHLGDCGEQEATAHGEGARLGAWVRDQRATSDGNNG